MLGTVKNNRVCVAWGEGFVSDIIDWLEPSKMKFEELASFAEAIDLTFSIGSYPYQIESLYDFLEALGLKHDWQYQEMTCCASNVFSTWMPMEDKDRVLSKARSLLTELERQLLTVNITELYDRIATEKMNVERLEQTLAREREVHKKNLRRKDIALREAEHHWQKEAENHAKVMEGLGVSSTFGSRPFPSNRVVAGPLLIDPNQDYIVIASRFGGKDLRASHSFYTGVLEYLKGIQPQKVIEVAVDLSYIPSFHSRCRVEYDMKETTDWEDVWFMKNRKFRLRYRVSVLDDTLEEKKLCSLKGMLENITQCEVTLAINTLNRTKEIE